MSEPVNPPSTEAGEQPKTSAGRRFARQVYNLTGAYVEQDILAIEAEVVREIRDRLASVTTVFQDDWMHESGYDSAEVDAILDEFDPRSPDFSRCCGNYLDSGECCAAVRGVAGLNASESPPTPDYIIEVVGNGDGTMNVLTESGMRWRLTEDEYRAWPHRDASESGPPQKCQCGHTREQHESRYDAPDHCTHRCVPPWVVGDAIVVLVWGRLAAARSSATSDE